MNWFTTLIKPLGNRGLGRLPGLRGAFHIAAKYFVPKGVSTVTYDGLTLDIDNKAYPEMLVGDGRRFLSAEIKAFESLIKPDMTVLDLGAAIGYMTLAAARLVGPQGRVIAFEPAPAAFQLLETNVERARLKNVTVVNKAISDKVGTVNLYISSTQPLANSLNTQRVRPDTVVKVATTTLDEFLGNTTVDVIKMNIEGSELLALKGMKRTIERNPYLQMMVEFDPKALGVLTYASKVLQLTGSNMEVRNDNTLYGYTTNNAEPQSLEPGRIPNLYTEEMMDVPQVGNNQLTRLIDKQKKKLLKESYAAFASLLERNPKARYLDLGCGLGDHTQQFAASIGTSNITGFEVKGLRVPFKLVVGSMNEGLPFESDSFDVVTASHIVEHVSSTDVFVQEVRRVLNPGGYVLIATPNLASGRVILELLLNKQPSIAETSDFFLPQGYPNKEWELWWKAYHAGNGHRRLFTLRGLVQLLEYHGFTIERKMREGYGLFFFGRVLQGLYAANLIVKARKQ